MIDVLEHGVNNPVEQVDDALIADGGVTVHVVTIHDGIADAN